MVAANYELLAMLIPVILAIICVRLIRIGPYCEPMILNEYLCTFCSIFACVLSAQII